jgi:cyclic beta-1,2-glucan synthetase
MPLNSDAETITTTGTRNHATVESIEHQALRAKGTLAAADAAWLPRVRSSNYFKARCNRLSTTLVPVMAAVDGSLARSPLTDDARALRENTSLIYSEMSVLAGSERLLRRLPHVRVGSGAVLPRTVAFAQAYFRETAFHFDEQTLDTFCLGFQETTALELREFKTLASALKLVLLEEIAFRASSLLTDASGESRGVGTCVQTLREVTQMSWKEALEPLILFDKVLAEDPTETYAAMDFESRDFYRTKVAGIASKSDFSEMQVAQQALLLAKQAAARTYQDPRIAQRESHIGYYLVAEGVESLAERVGYRPGIAQKVQAWLRRHPDEFFVPGIAALTLAIVTTVLLFVTSADSSLLFIFAAMLLFLLPGSQCAVQVMEGIITGQLTAELLPKFDFSKGIPADCPTLVAVPTLLLNEKQVHTLVEDLEVRFLGNHDANIHFALLSDLADSEYTAREENPLIELCSSLIKDLNAKYAGQRKGTFFLLHRHRVYNPREKGWMGWERKRGKLLDLNKLLRGQYDSFPIKVGDLSLLSKIRFVITLDSDTELPRGSAHRMIGTLAHPLNQAIIDPDKNIVVAGYGILQPRVGVSVFSTVRSRLAAVYAGQAGLDIYTRAVSDAYQDLYGEGSFTGKGIFEVDTVHQVLDQRFPRNALLSHDLIEGAYARAGLVSDIEVIEDYPSHYSAYNRRKHRWLRGDWQIAGWLLADVPDESGARVANPISLISRWKIFDNLRRSLVEPATFVLFLFGWLAPGVWYIRWTVAALVLLFLPAWFQLLFSVPKAIAEHKSSILREAGRAFLANNVTTFLTLVFLAHQTLLSLDAVVRAIVRAAVTRERLLEWETAAEAELAARLSPADRYLNWIPVLSIIVAGLVWAIHPRALSAALPILVCWASCKVVASWLNRPSIVPQKDIPRRDVLFVRNSALHTWRYYAEYCTEEHNWLIPDNVQEEPYAVAARVSPTNLGLLLNAQQVACELGFVTVPEMAEQMRRTMATLSAIPKHNGHILNWYDTRTLQPLPNPFVSSVDSGNLLASLWTLQQGCLARLKLPLLQPTLAEGLLDHLRALTEQETIARKQLARCESEFKQSQWLSSVLATGEGSVDEILASCKPREAQEDRWFREQTPLRLASIRNLVSSYCPWELPEFAPLLNAIKINQTDNPSLQALALFIDDLGGRLVRARSSASADEKPVYEKLLVLLAEARGNAVRLVENLRATAAEAGKLADAMNFTFLMNPRRKLMSVGFNVDKQKLEPACYDLLATESRTAVFVAIAKEDVPQECWFKLGRSHTTAYGASILLSWTGTMFEYLMPTIWMRSYPNTLLDRSRVAVVDVQMEYARRKGVPWGISESSFYKLDEQGNYGYQAFGIPQIALMKGEATPLVISPYSTFLALTVNSSEALRNLRRMERMGWFGPCGFYESADYGVCDRVRWSTCRLVKSWMAHHHGMSMLSMANFLCDNVAQRWFHANRRVQATELLLHEKPIAHVPKSRFPRANAA